MVPAALFAENPPPGRIRLRSSRPDPNPLNELARLEARSDLPEVQQAIREAIRDGRIRVLPLPGQPDRVRVVRA